MPKIQYIEKNLSKDKLAQIKQANEIIKHHQNLGFKLTLRQLYYQFVARNLIENSEKSYTNLGNAISDGRLCGLIDWNSIEDRTRNLESNSHWDSPSDIIEACARSYQIDKWEGQEYRPEVWIEKEALAGVVAGVCRQEDVSYFSCRGYTSQSEMWVAGQRLARYREEGQTPLIIHFGDHDPSGIDMTRDIFDRLELFARTPIKVVRVALNMSQVEKYNPPPNPAKLTDTRAKDYVKQFGYESWELDALGPELIADLARKTILKYRDHDQWKNKVSQEAEEREKLKEIAEENE